MRLEQIVEPGCPGSFFERYGQSSTQSGEELQNGCGFRFQNGFDDYLTHRIQHCCADRCLVNVQPNILFTAHGECSFRRSSCATITTYSQRGALLNNAVTLVTPRPLPLSLDSGCSEGSPR